jgi:hypothetical protein
MNGAQNTNDVMEILAPPADGDTLSRLHRLLESRRNAMASSMSRTPSSTRPSDG